MRFRLSLLIAIVFVLFAPPLLFAQAADPQPAHRWYYSTTGIALATGIGVSILKRVAGDVAGLSRVPTWIYAAGIAVALSALAVYVLGTIEPDNPLEFLWDALASAAIASGFHGWLTNATTPLSVSAMKVKQRGTSNRLEKQKIGDVLGEQ